MKILVSLILFSLFTYCKPLIAYDCANEYITFSKISTVAVNKCDFKKNHPELATEKIQLLQLAEESSTHVYQCKYEVIRTIMHCGMASHASMVRNTIYTFIKELSREECLNIHRHGSLKTASGRIIANIKPNATTKFGDAVAGNVDGEPNCQGEYFTDGMNEWHNVIVQYAITLLIRDFNTPVIASRNSIVIEGLQCDFSNEYCMDSLHGQSFWANNKDQSCYADKYDVLFEGTATKGVALNTATGENETVYSVVQGDTMFALQIKGPTEICSTYGLKTEHPRLFIVQYVQGHALFKKKDVDTRNLNLFTYVNSKMVYSEKHIRGEMDRLYLDLLTKICETERDLLRTQLNFAKMDPPAFAYSRTNKPGYTAVLLGELAFIIKCVPVEVKIRETSNCFNELPVTANNQSVFMTPRNHLLQPQGTVVDCNTLLQPAFLLNDQWFALHPALINMEKPDMLSSKSTHTWRYKAPGDLATAGIYSQKQLDNLNRQVMYSSQREAISNAIVRKILVPEEKDQQNLKLNNIMDENYIQNVFSKAWKKTWSTLTTIGDIMSAILALWLICRLIKFVIDSILHAYELHGIYGWGWQIIVMFWDVLTYMLLRRNIQPEVPEDHLGMGPTHRRAPDPETPQTIYPSLTPLIMEATAPQMVQIEIEKDGKETLNQITNTTNIIENHSYNTMV